MNRRVRFFFFNVILSPNTSSSPPKFISVRYLCLIHILHSDMRPALSRYQVSICVVSFKLSVFLMIIDDFLFLHLPFATTHVHVLAWSSWTQFLSFFFFFFFQVRFVLDLLCFLFFSIYFLIKILKYSDLKKINFYFFFSVYELKEIKNFSARSLSEISLNINHLQVKCIST